jgi:exodeoxyribonuclease V alpha subunit
MKSNPEPSTQEVLAGLVERVTFHNAENGFCVLRARARGHRDLATMIGHAAVISAGEWITASGEWINDRAHGQQFKARFLKTSAPSSIDGIEKYLGSGMNPRHRPRSTPRRWSRPLETRSSTSSKPSPIAFGR